MVGLPSIRYVARTKTLLPTSHFSVPLNIKLCVAVLGFSVHKLSSIQTG